MHGKGGRMAKVSRVGDLKVYRRLGGVDFRGPERAVGFSKDEMDEVGLAMGRGLEFGAANVGGGVHNKNPKN